MKKLNFMLVGLGPHAKRIYLPFFKKSGDELGISLVLGVDVTEKTNQVKAVLEQSGVEMSKVLFVDKFSQTMPPAVASQLTEAAQKYGVDAVIIATEPSAHKAYALWAMSQRLPVLMDKPLSTRPHAVSDLSEARGIYDDYLQMHQAQRESKALFLVNSQRRYHPGMRKVYELIAEIAHDFQMPVTSIQSSDADGQWFFPEEVLKETYHGYNYGYGKCSHSGYHYFDTVYNLYKSGRVVGKYADAIKVYASFIQPPSFFKQITQADYQRWFQDEYRSTQTNDQLEQAVTDFGEIDAVGTITLLQNQYPMCHVQLSLAHNSFCRRAWVKANPDLYKSNGRVKHEFHVIQQGPLQTIQIHGYQVSSDHNHNDLNEFAFGGNNHFDIYVFRNNGVVGGEPLKMYSTRSVDATKEEIDANIPLDRLTYEYSRDLAVREFVGLLKNEAKTINHSPLADHALPAMMMSLMYQSHLVGGPVTQQFHQ